MTEAIRQGSLQGVIDRMGNVLETVTIPAYPEIAVIKSIMLEYGAERSLMSGSGPTVFGIFPDEAKAMQAEQAIRKAGYAEQTYLVQPLL